METKVVEVPMVMSHRCITRTDFPYEMKLASVQNQCMNSWIASGSLSCEFIKISSECNAQFVWIHLKSKCVQRKSNKAFDVMKVCAT